MLNKIEIMEAEPESNSQKFYFYFKYLWSARSEIGPTKKPQFGLAAIGNHIQHYAYTTKPRPKGAARASSRRGWPPLLGAAST